MICSACANTWHNHCSGRGCPCQHRTTQKPVTVELPTPPGACSICSMVDFHHSECPNFKVTNREHPCLLTSPHLAHNIWPDRYCPGID